MNKAELIGAIAQKTEMTQKDAERALNAMLGSIMEALQRSEKVQLVGFGSFEKRLRSARRGKNPATGESLEIPAAQVPVFKAGKAFRDAVN